jgi:hypothetical protein
MKSPEEVAVRKLKKAMPRLYGGVVDGRHVDNQIEKG